MAKKPDYSLFINFFFSLLKKWDYSLIFRPSLFTIHYFFGSLFTIHYKKGPLFTNHYTPSRPSYMYQAAVHSLDAEFNVLEMTTSNAFFSRELKILYHFIHASILPTYLTRFTF